MKTLAEIGGSEALITLELLRRGGETDAGEKAGPRFRNVYRPNFRNALRPLPGERDAGD